MFQRLSLIFIVGLFLAGCAAAGGLETETEPESAEATGMAEDIVYTWRREGGIAGFCDVVTVGSDGAADVSNCVTEAVVGTVALTADERVQVEAWAEALAEFEEQQSDPAVVDAMSVLIRFNGSGQAEPTADDLQAINDLSSALVLRARGGPESLAPSDEEAALRD